MARTRARLPVEAVVRRVASRREECANVSASGRRDRREDKNRDLLREVLHTLFISKIQTPAVIYPESTGVSGTLYVLRQMDAKGSLFQVPKLV